MALAYLHLVTQALPISDLFLALPPKPPKPPLVVFLSLSSQSSESVYLVQTPQIPEAVYLAPLS